MSHEFENVVEHLRSHAGDALQAVFVYRGDDHRDRYRREDVRALHGSSMEATVIRAARSELRGDDDSPADDTGDSLRATVRVFDTRVIVHLPRDADSGAVVVLDPAAARNLTDFVTDARTDLYGAE